MKNQNESIDKYYENGKNQNIKGKKKNLTDSLIKFIFGKLKSLVLKLFLPKILIILTFVSFFIVIVILILFLPILIIKMSLSDPLFLINQGINIVFVAVKNSVGEIIGFNTSTLPGGKVNGISGYKYVVDGKTSDDKTALLKALGETLKNKTSTISPIMGLDDIFGKYNQSDILKLFYKITFLTNKDENFEKMKNSMENIYKLKYNRRSSDYFLFDYIKNKGNYSPVFKPELEGEILSKIKVPSEIDSFDKLKKSWYNGVGYYIKQSGSGALSNLITLANKEQASGAAGGTIIEYSISNMQYDNNKMLEFFYKKNTIANFLKIYGSEITDYSNNDIKIAINTIGNDAVIKDKIEETKITDLKNLLKLQEDEFINLVYNANKSNISIAGVELLSEDLGKLIIKRSIEKKYNLYQKIISEGLVMSLSMISKVSELGVDYSICRINQLYGPSGVQTGGGYPGGLHNGYDLVFETAGGSRDVALRSMIDGTVVISRSADAVGNQVVIKGNTPGKGPSGGDIYVYTEYLHLSSRSVSVGDNVSPGQQIGIQGNTGNSSGAHLHLGVFFSGKGKCEGTLNSMSGYFCAVPISRMFEMYGYENTIQQMGCKISSLSGVGSSR